MNEQLKNKILDRFLWDMRENIELDDHFHVDFEIKENGSIFEFVSTLYAEQGDRLAFDYDQPQEYEKPCVSCIFCNLVEISPEGDVRYWTEESGDIVYKAIEAYAR